MDKVFLAHNPADAADFIESWEGCMLSAYKPIKSEPYFTIGVGHYGPDVTEGMTITYEQSREFLREDIRRIALQLAPYVNVRVSVNQFIALMSLAFNVGPTAVKRSKLLRALNGYRFEDAAHEFLDFDMAGGQKVRGLTRRRKVESELFLTPDDE